MFPIGVKEMIILNPDLSAVPLKAFEKRILALNPHQ